MSIKINTFRFRSQLLRWALAMAIGSAVFVNAFGYGLGRNVIVNGVTLTPTQILQLERVHGEYIPDGRYWLDTSTGIWGYEGGPAQGVLGRPDVELNRSSGSSGVPGQLDPRRGFEDYTHDFCMRNPEINCL